jgi:hypothetical protein
MRDRHLSEIHEILIMSGISFRFYPQTSFGDVNEKDKICISKTVAYLKRADKSKLTLKHDIFESVCLMMQVISVVRF